MLAKGTASVLQADPKSTPCASILVRGSPRAGGQSKMHRVRRWNEREKFRHVDMTVGANGKSMEEVIALRQRVAAGLAHVEVAWRTQTHRHRKSSVFTAPQLPLPQRAQRSSISSPESLPQRAQRSSISSPQSPPQRAQRSSISSPQSPPQSPPESPPQRPVLRRSTISPA